MKAYKDKGEGVGILNYRTYSSDQQILWEPDILMVSRDSGLLVIEVKAFGIEAIANIQATEWRMNGSFYTRNLYPFKQGEKQLRNILKHCRKQPKLRGKVPGQE